MNPYEADQTKIPADDLYAHLPLIDVTTLNLKPTSSPILITSTQSLSDTEIPSSQNVTHQIDFTTVVTGAVTYLHSVPSPSRLAT